MTHAGPVRRLGFALLGGTTLVLIGIVAATIQPTRVVPGVRAAGVDVGGLDRPGLHARLEIAAGAFSSKIVVVRSADRIWNATHGEIGLALDVERSADEALAIGHPGGLVERARDIAAAASGRLDIGWPRQVADRSRLEAFVGRVVSEVDEHAVNGAVAISADGVKITRSRDGIQADRGGLEDALLVARSEDARRQLSPTRNR